MNDQTTPETNERPEMSELEETVILSVLAGAEEPAPVAGPEGEQLRREYTELLGLLPYSLDPIEPAPELKARVMAAALGDSAAAPAAGSTRGDIPDPQEASPAADAGTAAAATGTGNVVPLLRRTSFWPLALAAAVTLLMVGLSTVFYAQLRASEGELAELSRELASVEGREQAMAAQLARANEQMAGITERLAIITQPGAEACPLRPVGEDPMLPVASGILYIAADHQHWYLKVTGLEPVPEGKEYQVWFMTEDGPVSAGALQMELGSEAELGSPSMPPGITGVAVTVEPRGGAPRPTGSMVLYGDEKMELL